MQQRGATWVTRRNAVGEVTSLNSSLYLSDPDEHDQSIGDEGDASYITLPVLMPVTTWMLEDAIWCYVDRSIDTLE